MSIFSKKQHSLSFLVQLMLTAWLGITLAACSSTMPVEIQPSLPEIGPTVTETKYVVTDLIPVPDASGGTITIDTDTIPTIFSSETPEPAFTSSPEIITHIDENTVYIEAAIQDLLKRYSFKRTEISVILANEMEWESTALGCPLPDNLYAQVITPGYIVQLQVRGEIYTYHTDTSTNVILCGDDSIPIIPLAPDEDIDDGQPWIPVN